MEIHRGKSVCFGEKRTFREQPKIFTKLTNMDVRFTPNTVEKLGFTMTGKFIGIFRSPGARITNRL
jgi:hypothetical protein